MSYMRPVQGRAERKPCAARGIDGCGSKTALKNTSRLHNREPKTRRSGAPHTFAIQPGVVGSPCEAHLFLRHEIQQEQKGKQIQYTMYCATEPIYRTHARRTSKDASKKSAKINLTSTSKNKNKQARDTKESVIFYFFIFFYAHRTLLIVIPYRARVTLWATSGLNQRFIIPSPPSRFTPSFFFIAHCAWHSPSSPAFALLRLSRFPATESRHQNRRASLSVHRNI